MWSVAMIGSLPRPAESAAHESRENVKRTAPVRKVGLSRVGASVAGCPRTPPDAAKTSGLRSVFQTALRGLSNRSIVVVGNYCCGPITAEPCRAKARLLRPRRSCFAPAQTRPAGLGWRRRVLPPGPKGLLRRPFIAIAGLRRPSQYSRVGARAERQWAPRPRHAGPAAAGGSFCRPLLPHCKRGYVSPLSPHALA